jgi:hypothetical protein
MIPGCDGSRTQYHIGARFFHALDGGVGTGGAEGDLRDGNPAFTESLCQCHGIPLWMVQAHHRDNTNLCYLPV